MSFLWQAGENREISFLCSMNANMEHTYWGYYSGKRLFILPENFS